MPALKLEQVQAAMRAMTDKAMETPAEPVAMAIVDAAGNLAQLTGLGTLHVVAHFALEVFADTPALPFVLLAVGFASLGLTRAWQQSGSAQRLEQWVDGP